MNTITLMASTALLIGVLSSPVAQADNELYYERTPEIPKVIVGTVTAYTSATDETDDRPFEMASGKTVYDGAVACPSRFEFGHRVVIQGRIYHCEDRMNRRYRDGNNFDIWMSTKAEAYQFGKQVLEITIVKQ